MDKKYIKKLKINDPVIIYVPVCDESHVGYTHGKFVKAKVGQPWGDGGACLFFDEKIQTETGGFFSSIPTNQLFVELASPLIFAMDEFEELRADKEKRAKFFEKYPTPKKLKMFAMSESMRRCWWQTQGELKRMLSLKRPIILDMSYITVEPSEQ